VAYEFRQKENRTQIPGLVGAAKGRWNAIDVELDHQQERTLVAAGAHSQRGQRNENGHWWLQLKVQF